MDVICLHFGPNIQAVAIKWDDFANYAGMKPITVEVQGVKMPYAIFRTIYTKGAEHALLIF